MSALVFSKLDERLNFEESEKAVERKSLSYLEVLNGQHADPLTKRMDGTLQQRRQSGGKVRHKRQTLQDMARPLKQWLYKHRDNPYPTKTEKILLALGSHMTLVQVSNWFANARRRLKNTVRQPDLSWALRIKLYNKYVQGNAERLSISSDDSASEDGENPLQMQPSESESSQPMHKSVIQESRGLDSVSPAKYKSSLLNRYLNDSLRHVMASSTDLRKRNYSGSFSSNEYDEELLSPSLSETEANFSYRTESVDCGSQFQGRCNPKGGVQGKSATYWNELHAAMALTNLAQSEEATARAGTTSCIIQKSSHIAEIKTVKVPIAPPQ
ncbi:Homeobox protein Mohawk [Bagarius yarrelli]|uniref:Homeobox protein Mohawk n=1 Tax=Bagarius yarrelli TaxID=175774 RepID=A0A556VK89_BAGYA|nr:Homeobox protein Mohawk [Bagarius yarrelli]